MAIEFKLPELGENIEAGDVVNVLVSAGDKVEKEQTVLELETDKATIEVPSSVSGVIKEVYVQAGQTIKVGQLVLTVEGSTAAAARQPEPETAPDAPHPEEPAAPEEPPATKPAQPAPTAAPRMSVYTAPGKAPAGIRASSPAAAKTSRDP